MLRLGMGYFIFYSYMDMKGNFRCSIHVWFWHSRRCGDAKSDPLETNFPGTTPPGRLELTGMTPLENLP